MDHRGPEFAELGKKVLAGMKKVFRTEQHVVIYPASGTGAWEAALVNTLSPGDKVLMPETGHFAMLWRKMAEKLGLTPIIIGGDWRVGANPDEIAARLAEDKGHEIKAVCVVQNETSTGCASPIAKVRAAIDSVGHPALYMVDTISSLGSIDMRMDEWGVDVIVAGSQKGLMLPPGLSFNAISEKALAVSKTAKLQKSYWDWAEMAGPNKTGYFPYTPATNLLYGLSEALDMMDEQGLDAIFARHDRHAEATRRCVRAWGLEIFCREAQYYSSSLTTILMPDGHSGDAYRKTVLAAFDMSLGAGLTKIADKVFRIGHLGDFNDLMLMGTLAGCEMGLELAGVPHRKGGVDAAMAYLAGAHSAGRLQAAE
jgi:alanine-glyoxylate transaminase/serine-glyoxylate transaminase/serine-pyruvate transaminase